MRFLSLSVDVGVVLCWSCFTIMVYDIFQLHCVRLIHSRIEGAGYNVASYPSLP